MRAFLLYGELWGIERDNSLMSLCQLENQVKWSMNPKPPGRYISNYDSASSGQGRTFKWRICLFYPQP